MLIEILKPDFIHMDERGGLVQLVHEGFSQINYISSKKNCVRGNHFHKLNKEAFYVIRGRLKLELKKDDISETYEFKEGDMFLINSGIIHTFSYIEDTELISMYSRGVELPDGEMDMYRG